MSTAGCPSGVAAQDTRLRGGTKTRRTSSQAASTLPAVVMPWPQYILNCFSSVPDVPTQESDYYGPYDALLNYLFPPSEGFMINPQHKEPNRRDSVDMTVVYLVQRDRHVVFFLEIKVADDINHISTRARADEQVRQRYTDVFEAAAPVLHSASALGTRLCFYRLDSETGRITPAPNERDPGRVTDVAPRSWWCHDILEPHGEQRLLSVAEQVRAAAASIPARGRSTG